MKAALILLQAILLSVLWTRQQACAVDEDQDGLDDDFEMEIAEQYAPVLHTHSWELQEGLASLAELAVPSAGTYYETDKYNMQGSHWLERELITYGSHHITWDIIEYYPGLDNACTHGWNQYSLDWNKRLDFAPNKEHAAAQSKPLYFHVHRVYGEPYVYLQYWYFLTYNDIRAQDTWESYHEGDWEHVEIKLFQNAGPGDNDPIDCSICHFGSVEPETVYFHHHGGTHSIDADECWWSDDIGEMRYGWDFDYEHLNIWVSANAHGNYNRYDQVYNFHIDIPGIQLGIEDYTDNVDYGSYCPYYFDYDILVNMGELHHDGSNYWCYPQVPSNDHWTAHPTSWFHWLAWTGYFGCQYWSYDLYFLGYWDTPPPKSPALSSTWIAHFGSYEHPEYVSFVSDPTGGDYDNPGVTPVVDQYTYNSVPINWWSIPQSYGTVFYKVYRTITDTDPNGVEFDVIDTVYIPDTLYIDENVVVPNSSSSNVLYYYLTSVDSLAEESDRIYYLSLKVPSAPEGIDGEAHGPDWFPVIVWNLNSESDLHGFNIYREIVIEDSIVTPFARLNSALIRDTTYTDSTFVINLQGEEIANYYVTAVNVSDGESAHSDTLHGIGQSVEGGGDIFFIRSASVDVHEMFSISPNPFNSKARIRLSLSETQEVSISLYNIVGQRVTEFYSGMVGEDHTYNFTIDGTRLSAGIYFCQLKTKDTVINRKVILLK